MTGQPPRRYLGFYREGQAPGAIPNGTRVVKVRGRVDDAHPLGSRATVISSFGPTADNEYGYWVAWDDMPDIAVFVRGNKIDAAS